MYLDRRPNYAHSGVASPKKENNKKSLVLVDCFHTLLTLKCYSNPHTFYFHSTVIITKETVNRLRGVVALGSDEWYLKEIEEEYADPERKGYQREEISLYTKRLLKGYAEADYLFLGLHLEGAPDESGAADILNDIEELVVEYPPRFDYQPHWLKLDPKVTDFWTFKLYHWIKTCSEGINIHSNSSHWISVIETKELEIESYKVLQPFRKPVETPRYHPLVQIDLDILTLQY